MMDERKKKVLQAIVLDYIATGEPVGSRTIARRYHLGVSPATIRNEMADLEELGLIEQPHTSAGRIPSDRGYRYYVDFIMKKEELKPYEKEYIQRRFNEKMREIEQVLEYATAVISEMTNYAAIAVGPFRSRVSFKKIELLPIERGQALLLVVTNTGLVDHRILSIPNTINEVDLRRISKVLTARLKGLALEELKRSVLDDIYHQFAAEKEVCRLALELLEQIFNLEGNEEVYLDGTLNILQQPEFKKDVEKVRKILAFLEREDAIRRLLVENPNIGLTVKIGQENAAYNIRECSVISINYQLGGETIGSMGIIGPTRMNYARVIPILEFVANTLSAALTKIYGRE
ncbi:MAG: heat-inducible transcriptional repressor [Clostridia bacterium]|nr:heat-inducible transcriptional repressor [Clostridia bacterium]